MTGFVVQGHIYCRSPVFISHVESMKAVKSSVYSAAAIGIS